MSAPEIHTIAAEDRFAIDLADGRVAGLRWANPGAPRLLFSHATGFCASAYRLMLGRLQPVFDVYAVDLRGHGRTSLPVDPERLRSWNIYARDIAAVIDRLSQEDPGRSGWILAGHSCGAVVSALAAKRRADIAALALIEPVATPPIMPFFAMTPLWRLHGPYLPLVKGALNRRASWPTREAVYESYARKPLFSAWAPGALADYLEDGLVDTPEGVRLACDPRWEAATFAAQGHHFWPAVAAASCPVSVLAAEHRSSTLFPGARRRFERLGARVRSLKGPSHLIPLEAPDAASAFILEAAEAALGR